MDLFRSAFATAGSTTLHVVALLVLWWSPWPDPVPPPPPDDGSPVSLAAFDYDDAPELSSSPTPVATPTPPDEAPPAKVRVTATAEPLPDPMGVDSAAQPQEAPRETGEGEKAAQESQAGATYNHGAKSRNPKKAPAPCADPVADIEQLGPYEWFVERDLVDYYADHIPEIDKLGSVWTHKDAEGKPDGFRLGLPRCTVLRDGGLRSGDIVHDINGIKINNVLQAVAAYLKLRKEPILRLHVTRKKESLTFSYNLEQKDRKKKKGAK